MITGRVSLRHVQGLTIGLRGVGDDRKGAISGHCAGANDIASTVLDGD
nr:hypothetical protein [Pseudomonas helleri]